MIRSMTGFGSKELLLGAYHHRVEVRSVNSKYCDIKVKNPLDLAGFEVRIQQYIRRKFARGHIDILIFRDAADAEIPRGVRVNWELAEQYYKNYQSIRHKFGIGQDISMALIANAREVVTLLRQEEDPEESWKKIRAVLDEATQSVMEMREAEGKILAVDMAGRCNTIKEFTVQIGKLSPTVVENYKKRLREKIAAITPVELDEDRLLQEVCYFADRCDTTEELTRLRSHLQQFLRFLNEDEPVGRKLDFLVQEMNREANTIGSKSNNASISQIVVEIKSELEKLREQIQNVE